jgi:hypothetical protein
MHAGVQHHEVIARAQMHTEDAIKSAGLPRCASAGLPQWSWTNQQQPSHVCPELCGIVAGVALL